MSERSYGRAPDELRPVDDRAGLRGHRDRLRADERRRDARHLHRLAHRRRAEVAGRAAAAAGSPPSTGCSPRRPATASSATSPGGAPTGARSRSSASSAARCAASSTSRALGENTIYLDCDVLTADGGTRCASITGAYVALALACDALRERGVLDALAADGLGRRGVGRHRRRRGRCSTSTTRRTRPPRSTPTSS